MKIRFNPYSNGSKGLKALKNELILMGHDVKELKKRNSILENIEKQKLLIEKWNQDLLNI